MDLHYDIQGEGKPIVMIHGGGVDRREWKYLAPLLAKHYQVVTYDGRGCGQSPSQTEPANYVKDVLDVLDHLSIEKPILIGHSLGGQIAAEFALAYPDRLQKLVLIAPALLGFDHSEEIQTMQKEIQAAAPDVAKMTELVVTSPFCAVIQNSTHFDLLREMSEHNIKRMFEWVDYGAVWPEPSAIERLHEIRASTLFIRGTLDHEDNIAIETRYRVLPDIQFVAIEGGDHVLNLTHAEELYSEIVRFVEESEVSEIVR